MWIRLPPDMFHSNLQSFLNCTTPRVPTQSLSKGCVRNLSEKWQLPICCGGDADDVDQYYFTLRDLWGCYDEWSAYGAGAPIRLEIGGCKSTTVVQYYAPFLSGIQLYVGKSFGTVTSRWSLYLNPITSIHTRKYLDPIHPSLYFIHTNTDQFRSRSRNILEGNRLRSSREDVNSDRFLVKNDRSPSSDSEDGKLSPSIGSDCSSRTWGFEDSSSEPDGPVHHRTKQLGELYLQYFDVAEPHLRLPLREQLNKLVEEFPGLDSVRSIDLSPASWMAVAWYPIYHIPAKRNPRELYSAFLTYHTLSSCFQEAEESINFIDLHRDSNGEMGTKGEDMNGRPAVILPAFGLASYKMQTRVWINSSSSEDYRRFTSLRRAAASWLMQLDVCHPDFNFFSSHLNGI